MSLQPHDRAHDLDKAAIGAISLVEAREDAAAAILVSAYMGPRLLAQEFPYLAPFLVAQANFRHASMLGSAFKCQQNLASCFSSAYSCISLLACIASMSEINMAGLSIEGAIIGSRCHSRWAHNSIIRAYYR